MPTPAKKESPKRRKPPKKQAIRAQEPPATRDQAGEVPGRGLELEYREGFGYSWPGDAEMPGRWHVRSPVPCPSCKLVRLPSTMQAVIAKSIDRRTDGGGVAYLYCRGCTYKFKLPIVPM